MESLPLDIEEKLEKLPVIPFDDTDKFQEIVFSDNFTDIFNYYKNTYLPDTLKTKPELYQRTSLYLTLTSQDERLLEDTDQVLYRRPIPTIEEFLTDKFYMGYNNATLYNYWKVQLEDIFRANSPVRKVIFGGCIGCLTKDTVIATLNGNKLIEELLNNWKGNSVISYNIDKDVYEPDKIIDVFYSGHRDIYKIILDNDNIIRCTSNHRFLTIDNEWISIDTGLDTTMIMRGRTSIIKIKSIEYIGKEDVYDITTEKNHNFALESGIVAHNSGKSTVARKAFVYQLYRVLCLRHPRAVYNIDPDSTIANFIISMTLKQVYDTNLMPFVKLMETMPCFQRVQSVRSFENFDLDNPRHPFPFAVEKSTGTIFFPDNIIIGCGSGITHTIGYNIVNSFCLVGDTKVHTTDGDIAISAIARNLNKREFSTYTVTPENKIIESKIINCKQTRTVIETIRVYLTDDDYIECTPDHKFLISNPTKNDPAVFYEHDLACKYAKDLTENDELKSTPNEKDILIKRIETIKHAEPIPVYNLTVDNEYHNYPLSVCNSLIFQKNCDEINEKGVDEALKLLNSIDNRFSSRFQGSDLVFQSIVSSARTKNSPVGEYIRRLPQNDTAIKVVSPMLWEVKPDPNFIGDGSTFPVLVGNGAIPSKIVTDPGELDAIAKNKYEEPAGCSLIQVPTVYRSKFELQLDQSIQDIAGMTTADNSLIFRDTSLLEDPALNSEVYLEADLRDNNDLLVRLEELNMFEKDLADNWQIKRTPKAPRYCHIDLANGGNNMCDAGICILHKEYKINEVTHEKETIYVVDLELYVNAKNKIDYDAIKRLIINLVLDKNMIIHTVSADQFQSTMMLQAFEGSGCFSSVKKLSVDVKSEPYLNAAILIEKGHIKAGVCPKLKKELEALILDRGKVTRTTELKDGCDALVGAIYNAQLNYKDIPQYEYVVNIPGSTKVNYNDFIDTEVEYLEPFI